MRLVHRAKLVEGAVDDAAFLIVHQFQRDAAQAEDQDAGIQQIGFKHLLRETGAAGELRHELINFGFGLAGDRPQGERQRAAPARREQHSRNCAGGRKLTASSRTHRTSRASG